MTRRQPTAAEYTHASTLLSAPHLLTNAAKLAAENIVAAYAMHETVSAADLVLAEKTPYEGPALPISQKAAKIDWAKAKAEAARLGYPIPTGPLSASRRGQIVNELRANGALI